MTRVRSSIRTLIALLPHKAHDFLGAVLHATFGNRERQSRFFQNFAALLDVGAFHAHDNGKLEIQIAGRGNDTGRQNVAAQDAAKDVDEDALYFGIAGQNLEGVLHLLGVGASANVEEIRGRAASQLDDVHGGHGQTGAIDHAANGAVKLDVVELVARGLHFEWIFLVEVAQGRDFLVAIECVVVKGHLGVERDQPAVAGDDQRIDLLPAKASVSRKARGRAIARKDMATGTMAAPRPSPESQLAHLIGLQASGGPHALAQDGGGIFVRHDFDLHAARGAGHDDRGFDGAVDQDAEVELELDVEAFFNEKALDDEVGPPGPVCGVTSVMPNIFEASWAASSAERASFTPPKPCRAHAACESAP